MTHNPHSDLPAALQDIGFPVGPGTSAVLLAVGTPYGSETPATAAGEPPAPEYLLPLEVLLSFRPCREDFRTVSAICPNGIPVSEAAIPGLVAADIDPWWAGDTLLSDAGERASYASRCAWLNKRGGDYPWPEYVSAAWSFLLAELRLDLADPSRGGPLRIGADGRTLERRR